MRFSERHGFVAPRSVLQTEGMDDALRASLWNVVQEIIWSSHQSRSHYSYTTHSNLYGLIKRYWSNFFKTPLNDIPQHIQETIQAVRKYFFSAEWYEVYDFIEFTASMIGGNGEKFVRAVNAVLEREMSGYRLVDRKVVPITSAEELSAIEEALQATAGLTGARTHISRALALLSDRKNPDYRNSIKESISAVESAVQSITDNPSASLGDALKYVSAKAPMHPALNKGLSSLYGYTSDASGIRHALLEESELDFVDAKFMLAACSSFVNYLLGKAGQAES